MKARPKYPICLQTGSEDRVRVDGRLLGELLSALDRALRAAVRFHRTNVSVRRGQDPTWLQEACRFDFTQPEPGSFQFVAEAAALEYAPALDGFAVLTSYSEDPERADSGLLKALLGLAEVGVKAGGLTIGTSTFNAKTATSYRAFLDELPAPEVVRVVGVLEGLEGDSQATLVVGQDKVRLNVDEISEETKRVLWRKRVAVTGEVNYLNSGKVGALVASQIELARKKFDDAFEVVPRGKAHQLEFAELRPSAPSLRDLFMSLEVDGEDLATDLQELRGR